MISNDFTYLEVTKGATLEEICKENNLDVNIIARLNGLDIKDYMYPKQLLIVPKKGVMVYITKKGDTITSLEEKMNLSIDVILKNNPDIYLVENQLIVERENT